MAELGTFRTKCLRCGAFGESGAQCSNPACGARIPASDLQFIASPVRRTGEALGILDPKPASVQGAAISNRELSKLNDTNAKMLGVQQDIAAKQAQLVTMGERQVALQSAMLDVQQRQLAVQEQQLLTPQMRWIHKTQTGTSQRRTSRVLRDLLSGPRSLAGSRPHAGRACVGGSGAIVGLFLLLLPSEACSPQQSASGSAGRRGNASSTTRAAGAELRPSSDAGAQGLDAGTPSSAEGASNRPDSVGSLFQFDRRAVLETSAGFRAAWEYTDAVRDAALHSFPERGSHWALHAKRALCSEYVRLDVRMPVVATDALRRAATAEARTKPCRAVLSWIPGATGADPLVRPECDLEVVRSGQLPDAGTAPAAPRVVPSCISATGATIPLAGQAGVTASPFTANPGERTTITIGNLDACWAADGASIRLEAQAVRPPSNYYY